MKKAEVLNELFALVITGSQNSYISHFPEAHICELLGGNRGSKSLPAVLAKQVQVHLMRLNLYKFMGQDDMQPRS